MNASPTMTQPFAGDKYEERMTMAVLLSVVSILGIVGNFLTIFSVAACRKLQTLPNAFVVSLSLSDFVNCSVNIPVQITALTKHSDAGWFHTVCLMSAVLNYVLITCSVSMLDLIAINRFILITRSHHFYSVIYTKRNMIVTISGAWISIVVLLIALAPTGVVHYGYSDVLSLCQLADESRVIDILCGLLFAGSFFTVSFCYIKIYFHVRRHLRQVAHIRLGPGRPTASTLGSAVHTDSTGNSGSIVAIETSPRIPGPVLPAKKPPEKEESPVDENENRITMNMIIIVVCFFGCVLPTLVVVLLPGTQDFGMFTVLFLYSASCCNPIIYAWKHPVFRKVFKCIFSRRLSEIEEPSAWLRAILSR